MAEVNYVKPTPDEELPEGELAEGKGPGESLATLLTKPAMVVICPNNVLDSWYNNMTKKQTNE